MLSTIPAWILAGFAASLAAAGIEGSWLLPAGSVLLRWPLSIALHGAWLIPDIRRRAPLAASICWLLSVYFCRRALHTADPRTAGALLLEGLPLLLLMPPRTWVDRLTHWRRAQSAILAQLRLATGVVPWFRQAVQAFLDGPSHPASAADQLDMLADLDERAGGCEAILQDLLNTTRSAEAAAAPGPPPSADSVLREFPKTAKGARS